MDAQNSLAIGTNLNVLANRVTTLATEAKLAIEKVRTEEEKEIAAKFGEILVAYADGISLLSTGRYFDGLDTRLTSKYGIPDTERDDSGYPVPHVVKYIWRWAGWQIDEIEKRLSAE